MFLGHFAVAIAAKRAAPRMSLGALVAAAQLAVELILFAAAVWLYLGITRERDAIGRWASWSFAAFLLVSYLAGAFGPPPPGVGVLAGVSLTLWLLPVWAGWPDRHRELRSPVLPSPDPGAR